MSWVERIKSEIEITTGDGKVYNPLYMISAKTVDYNIAEFEFPEIEGTLVNRGTPKGARYNFELCFQGDDNVDRMLEFEQSCKDRRPWQVLHPMFDKLLVHPTSLKFDPSGLGVSKITGEFIETITEEAPRMSVDAFDKINNDVANQVESNAEEFTNTFLPEPADVNTLTNTTDAVYEIASTSIQSGEQSNDYLLLYNTAIGAINNLLDDVEAAAVSINDMLVFPASFDSGVQIRLDMLRAQFDALSSNIAAIIGKNDKMIYEMQAGAIINAAVSAAVNPQDGDYGDTDSVQYVVDILIALQNDYVSNLDALQSPNAATVDSYVPNYVTVSTLSSTVNFTIANLLNVAIDSRQRRTVILEADSNVILLAHRFYGVTEEENTIDEFIAQNNIGLSELLQIRVGREVVYYV